MTTLTDRYVWAVLRAVPQRPAQGPRARDPRARRRRHRGEGGRRHDDRRGRRARRPHRAGRPRGSRGAATPTARLTHRPARLSRVAAAPVDRPADRRCPSHDRRPGRERSRWQAPIGSDHRRPRRRRSGHRPDALLVHARVRAPRALAGADGPAASGPGASTTCPRCRRRSVSASARRSRRSPRTCSSPPALLWVQLAPPIVDRRAGLPAVRPRALVVLATVVPRRHARGVGFAVAPLSARPMDLRPRRRSTRSSAPPSPSRRSTCSRTTWSSTRRSSSSSGHHRRDMAGRHRLDHDGRHRGHRRPGTPSTASARPGSTSDARRRRLPPAFTPQPMPARPHRAGMYGWPGRASPEPATRTDAATPRPGPRERPLGGPPRQRRAGPRRRRDGHDAVRQRASSSATRPRSGTSASRTSSGGSTGATSRPARGSS